ncbi:hypothetical protein LR48_Vigan08g125300 [Vigna angularis]|uniref:Uncharacterized protein n=2 Tax=Phaseolus angularis TaxID=3914 RepID=A0A0L9V5V4_PHAAN|nr:uncharacterized protein LOC108339902 [Vigna angularis]KOM50426.1 hypothetical protein LR48_Vigan08g125300 [Vigna angularis]BAT90232.1 hypothetical protein VIGAN_06143700 [Vigna angularis var. angularis]
MAETQYCIPIIEDDLEINDDFFENFEAPKFVDFTAPDSCRPGDDSHWFCSRVGCDRKHEQELDSETVYKKFILRVMAARSPNVRFRKALNKREASANLKCPHSAPAKSRVSRMNFISSSSHKMTDKNVQVKPLSKVAATPNAKVRPSPPVAKALTTPRNNQKKVSSVEPFRSVQSKKVLTVGVPKSRVVSKALVFPSPKKVIKIKNSMELKTPMRALCSAMKKLELNGVKKNEEGGSNSLPVTASKKQLRGREVKSRVFDFLSSNNRKEPETNSMSSLKEKKVKKGTQKRQVAKPHQNDSSEKSRCGSLEGCHESGTSASGAELSLEDVISQEPTRGDSLVIVQVLSEASECDTTSLSNSNHKEKMTKERSENEEMRNSVSAKGRVCESNMRKAEEKSLASSDDKENGRQLIENDDKENASIVHENIEMRTDNDVPPKKAILGSKHEDDSRKTQKKSSSTTTASPIGKYRKLKPTNPKPFKLRTDERGILKEANLDRKFLSPLKETAVKGGGSTMRKHQNRKSETIYTKSESDTDYYSSCDEKSRSKTQENQSGGIQIDNSHCKVQRKLSATTPYKNDPRPKLQKPNDVYCSALPRKKEKAVIATKLSVIIEKPSVKPKAAKPRSWARKALTVPIEPKFHRLHVPKHCNNRKRT